MERTPKASRPHMPGYDLKPADQGSGLKPWSYAVERLERARGYWISTTRPDGRPHCVPIWGVWLREEFAFSTGAQSRKAKNIAEDPRVVISAEPADDAIVLEGEARLIEDAAWRKDFLASYGAKYRWPTEGFDEPVYSVTPSTVFSFNSSGDEFIGGSTRWKF
jgi:nitroimidazol reductase NimA-like FMN-containing flavoprotein (pyridoxamine 5'-phosphate oxidase superfamily)